MRIDLEPRRGERSKLRKILRFAQDDKGRVLAMRYRCDNIINENLDQKKFSAEFLNGEFLVAIFILQVLPFTISFFVSLVPSSQSP